MPTDTTTHTAPSRCCSLGPGRSTQEKPSVCLPVVYVKEQRAPSVGSSLCTRQR